MKIAYPCRLQPDSDGSFHIIFPDFDCIHTCGQTREEALFNAEEALNLTLEGYIEDGIPVPLPTLQKEKEEVFIVPSPRIQAALLVKFSRGDQTLAQLARVLETSWPSVARLEDPRHWSSLKQLYKTAQALGQKLVLSFET